MDTPPDDRRAQLGLGRHRPAIGHAARRRRPEPLWQSHQRTRPARRHAGLESACGLARWRQPPLGSGRVGHWRHERRSPPRPHLGLLAGSRANGAPQKQPQAAARGLGAVGRHCRRERVLRATGDGRAGSQNHGTAQARASQRRRAGQHAPEPQPQARAVCHSNGLAHRGRARMELRHQPGQCPRAKRPHERPRLVGGGHPGL